MGIVYKGYDEQIDRDVAVKTLQPHIIRRHGDEHDALRRFSSEVRSAGRCLHPNIVTVFDYLEDDGAPYIIMEHVPGGTLEGVINSGAFPPLRQVADLMTQILCWRSNMRTAKGSCIAM